MADSKPLSDSLSLNLRVGSSDVASVLMGDLLRRIASGEVEVTAVIEGADRQAIEQSLEITYVETKGTKQ